MRRRTFLAFVSGALVAALARAQAPTTIRQIGLLWIHSPAFLPWLDALRDGLNAHGYKEGKNIRFEQSTLVGSYDELPAAAARLAQLKVDIIVTYGSTATVEAQRAAPKIPIVATATGDPVKLKVAASLARPGKNVTGFVTAGVMGAGKRLEVLKEIVPSLRRCAVLLYPGSSSERDNLRELEESARELRIETQAVAIHTPNEIESAVASIDKQKVQAVILIGSTMFNANRERMIAAIDKLNLPASYTNPLFVEAGGLVAYAPDIGANFRAAAAYVDKIFKGAKPGDLPMQQPTRWTFAINLRTARNLGLKIPPQILLRADRVIE
jgi:putative ABC transport system substrate-binding protein